MNYFFSKIHFKIIFLFVLVFVGYIIFMPAYGFHSDAIVFGKWAQFALKEGHGKIYRYNIDYMPLYTYPLYWYARLQGSDFQIIKNLKQLLSFTLIFDMIAGYLLFLLINKHIQNTLKSFLWSLLYVLNLMIIYNTIFWGQIDGMVACVLFASFLFSFYGHLFWGCLFFLLAINLKLQAAIFLPIIAVLNFKTVTEDFNLLKFAKIIVALVLVQLLILVPFIRTHDLPLLKHVIKNSFGKYPFLSYSAFNFWFLVKDVNAYTASVLRDSELFWGLTLNRWGFILFCTSSFFALFHFLKSLFNFVFQKVALHFSLEKTLISTALVPLLFFFFNTQMHERYAHPAFIFLVSYAILYKKFTPYILASLAYFFSLESVTQFCNLGIYDSILFKNKFIACLYLFTIIYLFAELFEIPAFFKKKFAPQKF